MPNDAGPSDSTSLSPTERTRVTRGDRSRSDRKELTDVLAAGLVCHLGVVVDGVPRVLPTAYGFDLDGPDRDGTLYLHGSVAARSLLAAPGQPVCVTVTLVDGLVLARSGFHHSMNYRSAVMIGAPRAVTEPAEREHGLRLVVDHLVPGRSATLRTNTRKELAATGVLALPLYEASVKTRTGDPVDDEGDLASGTWAGVVPVGTVLGQPRASGDCPRGVPVPADVTALVARSRSSPGPIG